MTIALSQHPGDGHLSYEVHIDHRTKTGLDADNLSKPIWDALRLVVYPDDKLIRFRSSTVSDLLTNEIKVFDLSNMPDEILDDSL